VWNFVWSLKFYYKNNFCQSLLLKSCEIRLFYCKLNSRKRGNLLSVFHRNSLNTETIREVNWTEIDSNFTVGETQDYGPLQRQATNSQANSRNLKTLNWIDLLIYMNWLTYLLEFTFLAILKWTEINLRSLIVNGSVKKAKGWQLPQTFGAKFVRHNHYSGESIRSVGHIVKSWKWSGAHD